jgi:hypothetical protein
VTPTTTSPGFRVTPQFELTLTQSPYTLTAPFGKVTGDDDGGGVSDAPRREGASLAPAAGLEVCPGRLGSITGPR